MKNSLTAILLLWVVSCNESRTDKDSATVENKYSSWASQIKVVDIDSCEYILAQTGTINGGLSIVHKQNCKYCAARLKLTP
jgi:hypothetical protein